MMLQWGVPDTSLGLLVSSAQRILAFDAATVPGNWVSQAHQPEIEAAVLDVLDTHGERFEDDRGGALPVVSWNLIYQHLPG